MTIWSVFLVLTTGSGKEHAECELAMLWALPTLPALPDEAIETVDREDESVDSEDEHDGCRFKGPG